MAVSARPIERGAKLGMNQASARALSTACMLDCPDACSLDVAVKEGRIETIDAGEGSLKEVLDFAV